MLDEGQHEDVVMDRWADPLLARASALAGALRPDWSEVQRRLFLLGLMHAVVRFAVEDRTQLTRMAGNPDDLDEAVREWLAGAIRGVLTADEVRRSG